MNFHVAQNVSAVEAPPIAEAMSWVKPNAQSNRPFLNLCQAVPSYPPAAELQAEFARLALTDGMGGYTNIYGIQALRDVHAESMARDYAGQITASQVAISTGCNQAFAAAVMAVAEAGDTMVVPTPWYFNHQMWLKMLGIGIQAIPAFAAVVRKASLSSQRRRVVTSWLVVLGEFSVGISLALGFLTPVGLIVGIFLNFNYFLLAGLKDQGEQGQNLMMLLIEVVLLATGAGMTWGIDAALF